MTKEITVKQLIAQSITEEKFRPYGQSILPEEDGKFFDARDAQLNLENGTPWCRLPACKYISQASSLCPLVFILCGCTIEEENLIGLLVTNVVLNVWVL